MKKYLPLFLFLSVACNSSTTKEDPKEDYSNFCTNQKYYLIWHMNIWNPQWKSMYFDYLANCEQDASMIKKLAQLDAEHDNYTFIVYGFIDDITVYENIFQKHPIGFHTAGCDASDGGELYNNEVKRLLKHNTGLDYDSIMNAEFNLLSEK